MNRTITFLLAEDNELDAEKINRAFEKLKIDNPIVRAKDGVEALDYLLGENGKAISRPLILLLDLNMPRMNGLELLKEIRKNEDLKNTQVFVMTTSDDKNDLKIAHDLNVQGYIIKPIRLEKLMEALSVLNAYWCLNELPESNK